MVQVSGIDPLHVAIDVRLTGFSGMQLKHELGTGPAATFIEIANETSIVALIGALSAPKPAELMRAIDQALSAMKFNGRAEHQQEQQGAFMTRPPAPGVLKLTPRQAYFAARETVAVDAAIGRVAAGTLAAYPRGIPTIVQGEVITAEAVGYLRSTSALPGGHVRGAIDPALNRIEVCVE